MKPKPETHEEKKARLEAIFREIGYPNPHVIPPLPPKVFREVGRVPRKHTRVTIGPCGKDTFNSEQTAKDAIHNRLRKGANTDKLIAYHCHRCKGWHMTSRDGGRFNRPPEYP